MFTLNIYLVLELILEFLILIFILKHIFEEYLTSMNSIFFHIYILLDKFFVILSNFKLFIN